MLDVSGSMEGNLPLLRAAAEQLFTRLRPDDGMRVGAFGHEIDDQSVVHARPGELRAALPDAIAAGCADAALARDRRGARGIRRARGERGG